MAVQRPVPTLSPGFRPIAPGEIQNHLSVDPFCETSLTTARARPPSPPAPARPSPIDLAPLPSGYSSPPSTGLRKRSASVMDISPKCEDLSPLTPHLDSNKHDRFRAPFDIADIKMGLEEGENSVVRSQFKRFRRSNSVLEMGTKVKSRTKHHKVCPNPPLSCGIQALTGVAAHTTGWSALLRRGFVRGRARTLSEERPNVSLPRAARSTRGSSHASVLREPTCRANKRDGTRRLERLQMKRSQSSMSGKIVRSAVKQAQQQCKLRFGDMAKHKPRLPTVKSSHEGLQVISTETVADLVRGKYSRLYDAVHIADCRFPFEYNGGMPLALFCRALRDDAHTPFMILPSPHQAISVGLARCPPPNSSRTRFLPMQRSRSGSLSSFTANFPRIAAPKDASTSAAGTVKSTALLTSPSFFIQSCTLCRAATR